MEAEMRAAHHKLSVLQLAEALGNVSEACRQRGVSRTQVYEYKRRFQTHGMEGVKDLPPVPKSSPLTTPPEHPVRRPQSNGFMERFHRTVLLQVDWNTWLVHYNTERPHQGYRNMGRRPIDTIHLLADLSVRNES